MGLKTGRVVKTLGHSVKPFSLLSNVIMNTSVVSKHLLCLLPFSRYLKKLNK